MLTYLYTTLKKAILQSLIFVCLLPWPDINSLTKWQHGLSTPQLWGCWTLVIKWRNIYTTIQFQCDRGGQTIWHMIRSTQRSWDMDTQIRTCNSDVTWVWPMSRCAAVWMMYTILICVNTRSRGNHHTVLFKCNIKTESVQERLGHQNVSLCEQDERLNSALRFLFKKQMLIWMQDSH